MTTTPLPNPVAHLRIAKSWDGGAIVLTCSPSHEKAKPVFVLEDLHAYAAQVRADLEAENKRLREALENLADEFVRVYPIYYAEPWAHKTNAPLLAARAALESKP